MQEEPKIIQTKYDFTEEYRMDQASTVLNIIDSFYSNFAIIQTSNRDVYIDFLELPGIKKEGETIVSGKRILLSHGVAQKLAEVILSSLEKTYKEGNIEQYNPPEDTN
jgi:hypothetical protein